MSVQEIKQAWRGEEKLWKVFWGYGFFIAVCILPVLKFALFFMASKAIVTGSVSRFHWLIGGLSVVIVLYIIGWGFAVWKCAGNPGGSLWGSLAKIFVVLYALRFVYCLWMNPGIGGVYTAIVFAAPVMPTESVRLCGDKMADYQRLKDYAKKNGIDTDKYILEHRAELECTTSKR